MEKIQCNHALIYPKDAKGMANNVDPDQTALLGAVWPVCSDLSAKGNAS